MALVNAAAELATYSVKPSIVNARIDGQIMSQVIQPYSAPANIPRIVIPMGVIAPNGGRKRTSTISKIEIALWR